MKPIVTLSRRCVFILFVAGALGSSPEAAAQNPGLFELWVGHELVDCPSDPARLCYQIKNEQYEDWSVFEGSIGNFYYREGVAYILLVEIDPSIDEAEPHRTRYKVVQVLEEFETFADPVTPDRAASNVTEPAEMEVAPEPIVAVTVPSTLEPIAAEPPPPAPEPVKAEPPPMTPLPVEEPVAAQQPALPRTPSTRGKAFRGVLFIGSGIEARSFTPCGEEGGIWIEDESGAGLWNLYRDLVEAPNRPLLLDVRGELGSPPSTGFGAHYERQLTVFEVLRTDAENTDCAESAAPVVRETFATPVPDAPEPVTNSITEPNEVRISGGPPLWTLRIATTGLVYSDQTSVDPIRFPYTSPDRSANRASYVTSASGATAHTLKVVIDREPCPDAETGARRDFTVYITLDGRWLRGCVTDGDPLPAH